MFHFKIFVQYIDLSTVNKQTREANQLKDTNLLLQKRIREKDARIQELMIENNQVNDENNQLKDENNQLKNENNQLKEENKVQRMDLNYIRNRAEDMMNTMQIFFSDLQRKQN